MMALNPVNQWLFETRALHISPADKPFFYTSGAIGPFYINTHFLFDGEEHAEQMLSLIDEKKDDPTAVLSAASERYMTGGIFREVIDGMVMHIAEHLTPADFDCISGGERRDWFFSLVIAHILQKPHITLYKDLSAKIVRTDGTEEPAENLRGVRALHISDLITEASSYERFWIPAVAALGGRITASLCVVDRRQGGGELLGQNSIRHMALTEVDTGLFDDALKAELISLPQYEMVTGYLRDPEASMKSFLQQHPEFMQNALSGDSKTQERARLCLKNNIYGL